MIPVALLKYDECGLDHTFTSRSVTDVLPGNGDFDAAVLRAEVSHVLVVLVLPAVANEGQSLQK